MVWKIVGSSAFVPQHRPRFYLVAVRKSCYRRYDRGVPLFALVPETHPYKIQLEDVVVPLTSDSWKPHPSPDTNKAGYDRVIEAYRKNHLKVKPFLVPLVIDFKASVGFATSRIGEAPCLTRTRISSFGYWCSTEGGPWM